MLSQLGPDSPNCNFLVNTLNACVHSVLLYASELWAATQEDVSCLNRNDMMMIRWIKKDLAVKGLGVLLVQNRNAWRRAIHPKS